MKTSFLLACICFFLSLATFSQARRLSNQAEVSVLTIGPGSSLNDAFGHSAFRIKDPRFGIDEVYNYGIYDFNTPNFYLKFAQGKLHYLIGKNYYEDFYTSYVYQNRTIKEQRLNLSQTEKQQVFNYLVTNYKPENRAYLYDFFFDNCATKIKEVLVKNLNKDLRFNQPEGLKPYSFRSLIQNQLDANSWGSVGIDIALGSVIDSPATPEQYMFLPKYIHSFFNVASLGNGKPLVSKDQLVFKQRETKASQSLLFSPFVVFSLLSLIIIGITYSDYKIQVRTKLLDVLLFLVTGLIGILILLLWFATDHEATAQNYNLLWAFAINVFLIGSVLKSKPHPRFIRYLKFLVIMLCLLCFHWLVGIQVFALALIPLLIALALRYVFLIWYYNRL